MTKRSSTEHKATVHVRLKEGVLDPQGLTIKRALEDMGYKDIDEVRSGKFFEIRLKSKSKKESEEKIDQICHKLLTNPVIERYNFKLEK
jgi:phosphoribosylformylglycinamidine synthase PurS subunit